MKGYCQHLRPFGNYLVLPPRLMEAPSRLSAVLPVLMAHYLIQVSPNPRHCLRSSRVGEFDMIRLRVAYTGEAQISMVGTGAAAVVVVMVAPQCLGEGHIVRPRGLWASFFHYDRRGGLGMGAPSMWTGPGGSLTWESGPARGPGGLPVNRLPRTRAHLLYLSLHMLMLGCLGISGGLLAVLSWG